MSSLLFVIIIFLYYIPSMVAAARGHDNAAAIFRLNICLGWTVLGWIVALVWSTTTNVSYTWGAISIFEKNQVWNQVENQVWNQVENQVWDQVSDQVDKR